MGSVAARPPFSWYVDRRTRPTGAGARRILARARPAWDDLESHLTKGYRLAGAFHFMYGQRFGWALRFRRGGRLIAALYPNRNRVTVQIVLGRAQVAAAQDMRLAPIVLRALKKAKDYPEGRWLFVPVTTLRSAQDLKPLIALKMSRPRPHPRPRRGG